MGKREEVLVKWDKDKKWEELKEIKSVFVNPDDTIDPIPGVRYFMSECGGSKQPLKEEIIAMIISFLLTGIVPLLMALAVIGWYSVRARVVLLLSFLSLLIPCKVYDTSVLKWKIWDTLFDYFSYSIVFDEPMDKHTKYLFAEYPHGVTPLGCIVSGFAFPHFSPEIPCYISTRIPLVSSLIPLSDYQKCSDHSLLWNGIEMDWMYYSHKREHS